MTVYRIQLIYINTVKTSKVWPKATATAVLLVGGTNPTCGTRLLSPG